MDDSWIEYGTDDDGMEVEILHVDDWESVDADLFYEWLDNLEDGWNLMYDYGDLDVEY